MFVPTEYNDTQYKYTHRGHKYVSNLLLDVPVEGTREKGGVE